MGREDELREQLSVSNRLLTLLGRDIRTHLYSLLGLTERFMHAQEMDERMTTDYLGKMYASQEAMINVLDDVLEISNLSVYEEETVRDHIMLDDLFTEVERELAIALDMKNQSLVCTIEEGVEEEIITDERMLFGILTRLLRYVNQYACSGENLVGRVDVARKTKDSGIYEFHLSAERLLIPEDRVAQDLAFRESVFKEITRNPDEIDMGLIVMKKHISMMGGEIGLLPSQEGGVHILLRLPFAIGSGGREETAVSFEGHNFEGLKLLLTEDDMINLEVGHRIASSMGMDVIDAGCGREAVDIFSKRREEIDLVILDIRMPDMSGYEVAKKIRSLQGDKKVPIIALTSNATKEDRMRSAEAGIDEHLNKPIDRYHLGEAIKRLL